MTLVFGITFSILLIFYVAAILVLRAGFSTLVKQLATVQTRRDRRTDAELPTVAIIVAARNESRNLPNLLRCLLQQDYPPEKLEICIVDDRSEDDSWQILETAAKENPKLHTIRITDTLPYFAPKKRALDRAIRQTSGEIILLTDGDCTPSPGWARQMVSFYAPNTAAIPGYSPYRFDHRFHPLFEGMLALDYFAVAAVAAAAVGLGRPLTAAGCNLSYRRKTFFEAGGFEAISHWVSGDDDLFVLSVARKRLGEISYALAPEAFVPAAAPRSWRAFWNQRIRYASKGKHYAPTMTAGLIAVYLLNAGIFFGAFATLLFSTTMGWWTLAASWLGKSLVEYSFLHKAAHGFGEQKLLKFFVPTAIVHPLYIIIFGFLGLFGRFEWKGDVFAKTQGTESQQQSQPKVNTAK